MASLVSRTTEFRIRRPSPLRGLALLLGALVWMAAGLVGAALAVFFAATVFVIALLSTALLVLSAAAVKVRGSLRRADTTGLIEATRVGGHSWVAYAWDRDI